MNHLDLDLVSVESSTPAPSHLSFPFIYPRRTIADTLPRKHNLPARLLTSSRFLFLSHNFNYASRALSLATKVVVNQMVFTPGFSTYFFGMQALLSGESLAATAQRLRDTVPRAFVNALKLWPAVTVVNFSVVPLEYRSIVAGIVAVGWQTYLSYLNRLAEMKEEEGAAAAASETAAAAVVA